MRVNRPVWRLHTSGTAPNATLTSRLSLTQRSVENPVGHGQSSKIGL